MGFNSAFKGLRGGVIVERLGSIVLSGFSFLFRTLKLHEDPHCCTLRGISLLLWRWG